MSQVLTVDGAVYRHLHRFTRGVNVSLLWAVLAATVVLSGPATAALCAVARRWNRGDDPPVVVTFLAEFRTNLKQGLQVQVLLLVSIVLVAGSVVLLPAASPGVQVALVCLITPLAVAALIVATWAFPLMVSYEVGTRHLLRTALLLGLSRPLTTLVNIGTVLVAGVLSIVAPILPLIVSGLVASTTSLRCRGVFEQVDRAA